MKKRRKKEILQTNTFPDQIYNFLQRNRITLLITFSVIYIIFSFFTFNLGVSEGGDDSTYIIRALSLLEEGKFPDYQGPLYPLTLSLFIAVFGVNLALLKLTSWIFLSLSIVFLFKAFKNRISAFSLWSCILALILNHHFLYFGSQTYSEAFFLAIQSVFLLYLFHVIDYSDTGKPTIKQNIIAALILFLMLLTKNIAIAALPAVITFWIIKRQPRAAFITALSVIIFALLFLGAKTLFTEGSTAGSEQLNTLLLKNPYNSSEGHETLSGFFERFAGNSKIYLSKFFVILTGFKSALSLSKQPFLTILLYVWFITGMLRFFKRNKTLLFTGLYLAFMLSATFFALQTLWDQIRLIIPFFPLMILFLIETIVSYTAHSKFAWKQKIPLTIMALSILLTLGQTIRQTDFSAIFRNVAGDRYYSYTPDWQNYLKIVEHSARALPPTSYVACRKPNIARVYADGKKFYGIYRLDTQNPDSLMALLNDRDVTHIIAASLRKNPRVNSGQVINTIRRYMRFITQKYSKTFILLQKTGKEEPAYLFEIDYSQWIDNQNRPLIPNDNRSLVPILQD